jgi:alkanesulfonate monooxygenase
MSVQFIGYIGFNNHSEIHPGRDRHIDRRYVEDAAHAQERGGFDRVLVPFGSSSPESQIVAAHASALTTKLGFLIAHRPGFTQPTLAARQLATLDQLSGGRVAVHIITGGADEEMARDGDTFDQGRALRPHRRVPRRSSGANGRPRRRSTTPGSSTTFARHSAS